MGNLPGEIRYAIRTLLRSPGFSLAAILTLALGIGATTAIFTVVNGVLVHPLPYPNPHRLVMVWGHHPTIGRETASLPDFLDWRRENRSFDRLAAWANAGYNMTGAGEPEVVRGAQVTADFFPVLGAAIPLGRGFEAAEELGGAPRVVVIGHDFWRRRFGGSPDVIGRTIVLSGVPHTIVGVAGRSLGLPEERDILTPMVTDTVMGRRNDFLHVIGRLRPGIELRRAQDEMATIARRLETQYPASNAGWGTELVGLQEEIVGPVRPALWTFMGAVLLVLLIACANVANLMLARSAAREREATIRTALGASRRRLVRQLLVECLVLSLAGGVLGIAVAAWGVDALRLLETGTIPRLNETRLDGSALGFALALSLLTGLLFGLAPALRLGRDDLREGLQRGGRAQTGSRGAGRTRSFLVQLEVAIAFVLLVGAALLLRSFDRLQRIDPGFRGAGVLTARVTLPRLRYGEPKQQVAFVAALRERLDALPGVTSAALASDGPMGDGLPYWGFAIAGQEPLAPEAVQDAAVFRTSPRYFTTLGIPLVRGRAYDDGDREGANAVAVISRSMAERYWPGRDPLGSRITLEDPADPAATWMTIVGVVGDVHEESPGRIPYPQLYLPIAQVSSRSLLIVARTAGNPTALVPALRGAVQAIDRDLPLSQIATMDDRIANTIDRPRVNALMLGGFALSALALAAIGIYGVIAYGVVQRTRELGIRLALGAGAGWVIRLVIRQGMAPVFVGIAFGLAGALAGGRVLRSLLFGVGATDPIAFGAVTVFLVLVAFAATWLPARRAARSDPMTALRAD
ncbi:MAG TPA: ABC transporter permease [Gemmatimonadales bacterium]|jgi:predicted permease